MLISDLYPIIKSIADVDDQNARDLVTEILVIASIPENPITTEELINLVIEESRKISNTVPGFEFSGWSMSTIIETVDFLITCGSVDGPLVDLSSESHVLLEAEIKRTSKLDDYEKELTSELWEYLPEASER